jgi:membrane AbrB-like protein
VAYLWILPCVVGLSLVLNAVDLPAATLFAALVVGLAAAVRERPTTAAPVTVPSAAVVGSQACLGALIGALVEPRIVRALVDDWLPVVAAVLTTLVISLASGIALSLHRDVDPVTGSFALVAGGAAGVTGISRELGADQHIVGVVQYLRVLALVLTMPAVAGLLAAGSPTAEAARSTSVTGETLARGLAFTAVCVLLGLLLARAVRLPAGSLLGPMVVATALTATGASAGATVPAALQQVAFAVIGLQVGLSFTRASVRAVGRVLPAALSLVVIMTVATAGVGIPLLQRAGASLLDAYLATTPGGLYAVLATAADTGADTTLIASVQVLRLLVMLLVAPLLAALLGRRGGPPQPPS